MLKKEVAKVSFLPNFSNETTSVAKVYDANNTSLPHCLLAASPNEVNEFGLYVPYFMATEVVFFEKLGENEVVEENYFRQKISGKITQV
ncbi:MAG: hypothetical protein LBO71_06415 [Prevotellaceae bacterium]|nr:hypothetical protein [Prevotellaceae bacterium]